MILVWDNSANDQNEKRLMKIVDLAKNNAITTLTTVHDKFLVCGFENGQIYDFQIVVWFDELDFSNVKSISFSKPHLAEGANFRIRLQ